MLQNNAVKVTNKNIQDFLELLQSNDKIYGAFIFGSRAGEDFTEESDWDIALFTDLEYLDIAELEDDFNTENIEKVDLADICNIPGSVQEYIMENEDTEVLFMKEDYLLNWQRHKLYLNQEIHFRKVLKKCGV